MFKQSLNLRPEPAFRQRKPVLHTTLFTCCLLFAILYLSGSAAADQSFPLRSFYPNVTTISTEQLQDIYFTAIVIDVRNSFEYDFIHISKAKHVPLSAAGFVAAVQKYRSRAAETPIILYCNDSSCTQAFRAAMLLQAAGFKSLFVYDAGVFSLMKTAPEKITLMAATPAQPDLVIADDFYERVRLDFVAFKLKAALSGTLVVDIRDIYSRSYIPVMSNIHNIPTEAFLQAITNRIWLEKKLLIFDQDGSQTAWIQYFLEANGYTNYFFLRYGVKGLAPAELRKSVHPFSWFNLDQEYLIRLTTDSTLLPLDIRFISLLAGSINFENHAIVDLKKISALLNCSPAVFEESLDRLRAAGYLLYDKDDNVLILHINPRLAWKGTVAGATWTDRVREFDAATCTQETGR
jgi:rhodanese-related sulfurtransferase